MLTRRRFTAAAALAPLAACQTGSELPLEASDDGAAAPRWRNGPRAPYAVQEVYPAFYRGAIWVAGGFAPLAAFGATQRVVALDLARNAWVEAPSLPTPSHHVHLAALDDGLWAIGGFLGGDDRRSWICTSRVLKFDGERWIEGPSLPKPIGEAAPIVHQGRIHLIGGRSPLSAANAAWDDQGDVDDHFVIAAGETAWSRAAPLPLARNSAAGVSDGVRLHVISGRTVADGQTAAHHIYDPIEDRWRDGPAFPEPRGGVAGAFWRGRVVAGGGEIFEPGSVGDALFTFDGAAWSRFATMPVPRHGHGLVGAGDALYAIGGAQRPSASGTLARVDVLR